jgi:hypothetical protein
MNIPKFLIGQILYKTLGVIIVSATLLMVLRQNNFIEWDSNATAAFMGALFGLLFNLIYQDLMSIIKKYNEISAYGAARSGPTLLRNMGLENKVKYIFDDHPMKISRYTPSSGIKIIKTDNLKNTNTDLCIITAYLHSKKIIKKNIALIKKGLNFMVLYPKPRIINFKNYKIILNEKN